ncbi:MAG: hypothetical protein L0H36_02990 [bacterium]|nr:hypothetical protein [bacterium]
MQLTPTYLNKLADSFPDIKLQAASNFKWSPDEQTVYYDQTDPDAAQYLLHEISHALLSHTNFSRDIELLKLERDAWDYASSQLADRFETTIDDDLVQDSLDTYRDWLHSRSSCPKCASTGIQNAANSYQCPACQQKWRVNDGRGCQLRRYKIK